MRTGVLTSSRADYSIYLPLLKALQNDPFFQLEIIAFGTHLSEKHGHTIDKIFDDGFNVRFGIDAMPDDDTPLAISQAMGKTVSNFSGLWEDEKFDLVFCLGDRYEMFAACASGVPFNVKFAHIHGGEQTLGAIDEAFRHSLTHMSQLHFTTTDVYKQRVVELKGDAAHVYNTGALSVDNLKEIPLLSKEAFQQQFHIDISIPSILITFHPETVSFEKNITYTDELLAALDAVNDYQLIITMPNTDTMGNMIREKLQAFAATRSNVVIVESFGTIGYLSCMKHCSFMLGNTSSGFVEAAFFPKYVINLGDRQKGRIITPNIRNCEITREAIALAIAEFKTTVLPAQIDAYGDGTAAEKIINILKHEYAGA